MTLSHDELERELNEKDELLAALRKKIDALPVGNHERETAINTLMEVHTEIEILLQDNDYGYSS